MTYAEVFDVEAGFRALSKDEQTRCAALLSEAAIIIDAYNPDAGADAKQLVSCRMVPKGSSGLTPTLPPMRRRLESLTKACAGTPALYLTFPMAVLWTTFW